MDEEKRLLNTIRLCLSAISVILIAMAAMLTPLIFPIRLNTGAQQPRLATQGLVTTWSPPDSAMIPLSPEGDLIRYGRELVSHTAVYLGPQGSVSIISNGMNCQNCHLKAGKKKFGNNFSAVASTYPKFRPRSGTSESIEKRVNDCLVRSLNGKGLEESSREMRAFVSYIQWVGKEVPKDNVPEGAGIFEVPFLDRAADPQKGRALYEAHCLRCHGRDGEGIRNPNGLEWLYPPLWGPNSYNTGAGIFRLSRMAGYIKMNMPNEISSDSTALLDEEAWDIAAFVNSMPRPTMDLSGDWPNISAKPIDHPFGPFVDEFSENQHKYGPFQPIKKSRAKGD